MLSATIAVTDDLKNSIKISIIEDSEIHSEWLKVELSDNPSFNIVSIDRLGRKGVESIKTHKPDLVLIDFQLEDMTGLEVIKRIKAYDENIKIFVVTAHTEAPIIERIINDKNVDAIAVKGSRYFENDLLSAIRYVMEGEAYFDPSLMKKLRGTKNNALNSLTRREFEVFIQINSGKADTKIAEDLCVELPYIKNIKSKITKKVKGENLNTLLAKLIENVNHNRIQ